MACFPVLRPRPCSRPAHNTKPPPPLEACNVPFIPRGKGGYDASSRSSNRRADDCSHPSRPSQRQTCSTRDRQPVMQSNDSRNPHVLLPPTWAHPSCHRYVQHGVPWDNRLKQGQLPKRVSQPVAALVIRPPAASGGRGAWDPIDAIEVTPKKAATSYHRQPDIKSHLVLA